MQSEDRRPDDPIGIALGSIGAGATSGAGVVTLGLLALRLLQGAGSVGHRPVTEFLVLSTSLIVGLGTAVAITFVKSRPIHDHWRRAVAGAIAMFGAALLAAAATPLDILGGWIGLLVYLALLMAGARFTMLSIKRAVTE